jgi:hypothetical protein
LVVSDEVDFNPTSTEFTNISSPSWTGSITIRDIKIAKFINGYLTNSSQQAANSFTIGSNIVDVSNLTRNLVVPVMKWVNANTALTSLQVVGYIDFAPSGDVILRTNQTIVAGATIRFSSMIP